MYIWGNGFMYKWFIELKPHCIQNNAATWDRKQRNSPLRQSCAASGWHGSISFDSLSKSNQARYSMHLAAQLDKHSSSIHTTH